MGLAAPWHVGTLVPQPGIEPTFPALQSRFLTTEPLESMVRVDWDFRDHLKQGQQLWPVGCPSSCKVHLLKIFFSFKMDIEILI